MHLLLDRFARQPPRIAGRSSRSAAVGRTLALSVTAGVMPLKSGDRFGDRAIVPIPLRELRCALAESPTSEHRG
jgi:hypothetical protein